MVSAFVCASALLSRFASALISILVSLITIPSSKVHGHRAPLHRLLPLLALVVFATPLPSFATTPNGWGWSGFSDSAGNPSLYPSAQSACQAMAGTSMTMTPETDPFANPYWYRCKPAGSAYWQYWDTQWGCVKNNTFNSAVSATSPSPADQACSSLPNPGSAGSATPISAVRGAPRAIQ